MLATTKPARTSVAAQTLLLTDCRSDQQLYALWIARFRSGETIHNAARGFMLNQSLNNSA